MTKVILLGYGAMGKELERLASSYRCTVVNVCDLDRPLVSSTVDYDVAIDFTQADAVIDNARIVLGAGKDLVIGTTGWHGSFADLKAIQQQFGKGVIHGSNFSVGVQMFFQLVRAAGDLANNVADYDVMVNEWHHKRKRDSPSGTALTAAEILLDAIERKTQIEAESKHSPIQPNQLHVTSTRGGEIVGRHLVTLDSLTDSIEIQHTAKSREGFAQGALLAATWIHGRPGLFDFADVFSNIISSEDQ